MARKITIEFLGNDRDLKRSLDSSGKSTSSWGDKMKKVGKVAAVAFTAAAAGALVVGKALINAGERASTSNARIGQVADSMGIFGDQAGAVTDRLVKLAEKQALATGLDQNAIKLTQAKLLTFKELAKSADEVGGSFDRATTAAVDMAAAGFGEASSNAVQLGKALNDPIKGITALNKSGITFTEVEKKKISAMVESGKTGKAQEMILKAIENQVGGTAEATANGSDQMKVAFSQISEKLGQKLLPAFNRLSAWVIETGLPMLSRFGEFVRDKILPPVTQFAQALAARLAPTLTKVGDLIATRLLPIVRGLAEFIVGKWVPAVAKIVGQIANALRPVLDALIPVIVRVAKKVEEWRPTLQKVGLVLLKVAGFVAVLAAKILGFLLPIIIKLAAFLGGKLVGVIVWVIKVLAKLVQGVIYVGKQFITGAKQIGEFGRIVVSAVAAVPGKIRALAGRFGDAGRALINAMVNGLKNAGGLIAGIAGNVWSAVRGMLNSAISKINAALEFTISLPGPDIHINPPNIPQLMAKGGIVTGPTLALIGEDGPEAVVPLGAKNAPRGGISGLGGTTIIHVHGALDPNAVAKQIETLLLRRQRLTGKVVLS